MTPADEATFITLWQQGLETVAIAQRLGIPAGTARSRAYALQQQGKIQPRAKGGARQRGTRTGSGTPEVHPGTPAGSTRHTEAYPSIPPSQYTEAHSGAPSLPAQQPTTVHLRTSIEPYTQAHPGVPMPNDLATRLLSLLPDLEVMVARERDRQRLLSTPVGTPRHTVKKTYVVDTLDVDLIERYAQAEGVELKDVVNLAFHEFFERRRYLPDDAP